MSARKVEGAASKLGSWSQAKKTSCGFSNWVRSLQLIAHGPPFDEHLAPQNPNNGSPAMEDYHKKIIPA